MTTIFYKEFGRTKEGKKVTSFEMKNDNNMSVIVLDLGCTIQNITALDKNGIPTDVVLGYDDVASYIENGDLIFKYFSPDMEEGYPGNLSVKIRYHLCENNSLEILYEATTDAPTIINLTNHCYFNLNGQDGSTILNHRLKLNCSNFTEYNEVFSQTGKIIPVDNTPLDFRKEQAILLLWVIFLICFLAQKKEVL